MKTLSHTWFAEGYIDFELKKYTLLAYLQEIHRSFTHNKLYPQLADLIFHYNNIVELKRNKEVLREQFPKELVGVDNERLQLLYRKIVEDDELMKELEDIIVFATSEMQSVIKDGAAIYEFVEDKMHIDAIGIVPVEPVEGFFFLSSGKTNYSNIYAYKLHYFNNLKTSSYKTLETKFVRRCKLSLHYTYAYLKADLLKESSSQTTPAVYSIETTLAFPVPETVLPIAKRSLLKHIASA